MRSILAMLGAAALVSCAAAAALPAFPGAEGFGASTPGGRGGRVLAVTTLAPEGPGSLAEALAAKGPRIVVFRVGGVIEARRDFRVTEPFLTIAGQTAPGDGICIKGAGLVIGTHDVVVRFLRVRVGDEPQGGNPENRDGIGIANRAAPPHHIVLDHCSVSWAIDENLQLWYPCHDITIQWCITSEALERSLHPKGAHGMGLLVGDHARRVSVHHTLFAHNMDRNPLMKGDTVVEVLNNVVYNWRHNSTWFGDLEGAGPHRANVMGNVYLAGPQTRATQRGIAVGKDAKPGSAIYVRGNLGPGRERDAGDDWSAVMIRGTTGHRVDRPAIDGERVTLTPLAEVQELVLARAGATLPRRDAVDARVVAAVRNRDGRIIDSPKDVGGWPGYRSAAAPVDSDRDGMPDDWEVARGLDPRNPRDGAANAPSGYTWIEEYLNALAAAAPTPR